MQEMHIYGVSFDIVGKQPIVLLKTADGNKFLPIWIGHPEAAAILMKLQGAETPRPMTHDLLTDMLSQLEARVIRITVTELRDSTSRDSGQRPPRGLPKLPEIDFAEPVRAETVFLIVFQRSDRPPPSACLKESAQNQGEPSFLITQTTQSTPVSSLGSV